MMEVDQDDSLLLNHFLPQRKQSKKKKFVLVSILLIFAKEIIKQNVTSFGRFLCVVEGGRN